MAETPMMRHYNAAKKKACDALLFFRMGDFYELFFEDARSKRPSSIRACSSKWRSKSRYSAVRSGWRGR